MVDVHIAQADREGLLNDPIAVVVGLGHRVAQGVGEGLGAARRVERLRPDASYFIRDARRLARSIAGDRDLAAVGGDHRPGEAARIAVDRPGPAGWPGRARRAAPGVHRALPGQAQGALHLEQFAECVADVGPGVAQAVGVGGWEADVVHRRGRHLAGVVDDAGGMSRCVVTHLGRPPGGVAEAARQFAFVVAHVRAIA